MIIDMEGRADGALGAEMFPADPHSFLDVPAESPGRQKDMGSETC